MIPAGTKAVFFDAAGTVLLPNPGAVTVYAAAAERYGLPNDVSAIRSRLIAAFRDEDTLDERSGWITGEDRERDRWRTIVERTLPGAPRECFEELYQHFADPNAWGVPVDAPDVFEELHQRGIRLGLASNYDSRLESVVAGRPELAPLAAHVVISSRLGVRKPGLGFFHRVVELAQCDAQEVLLVGDDYGNDYVGAIRAGLQAVLLDPANRHPEVSSRVAKLAQLLDGCSAISSK